ncbi:MAG: bifunctional glycosyltransferase/class I SAM-dependent methyltransferase [Ignavibacteriae bacterium]|nr:bifunctional glycosyltransferase/class I SAM-dependent methyltransferase [Ignavibacteriota bacterium]
MKNGKKIGILVVAYNAVSTLNKVLDRIPQDVYAEIDEIAVFDDASKDNTYMLSLGYKQVKQLDKLNIFLNEKNLGYGGNQKKGFAYFSEKGFDAVVLLHGDGQYAPEVLSDMYSPLVNGTADVVLGSRMMTKYGGALKGGMPFYKFIGNKILSYFQNHTLKMDLTEFHSGYRAYSIAGLKKLMLTNCTDDFHFDTQIIIKANHNNLKIIEVPIPTYYGDEICYVNGMKYARNIFRTTKEYIKTIKGKIRADAYSEYYTPYPLKLYPFSSHMAIINLLNKKENQRILDAGCGDGLFSEHISRKNYKLGVDFIPESDNTKKNFDKYIQFNLNEGLPVSLKSGEKFDYILMLDILEHLVDYKRILEDAKDLIKEDGKIIISLPNIANIYVRLNLLLGRFPYAEKGILDKTHIRFFTLGSIKQLMRIHRLRTFKIIVTPIPIIEVLPDVFKKNAGYILNLLLYSAAFILKRLYGYQFIFISGIHEK